MRRREDRIARRVVGVGALAVAAGALAIGLQAGPRAAKQHAVTNGYWNGGDFTASSAGATVFTAAPPASISTPNPANLYYNGSTVTLRVVAFKDSSSGTLPTVWFFTRIRDPFGFFQQR